MYTYVDSNPIRHTDRYGLLLDDFMPSQSGGVGKGIGAVCAANRCNAGSAPASPLNAYMDCMRLVRIYSESNPEIAAAVTQTIGGSDAVIWACAEFCSKVTNSKKYKKECLNTTACL